MFLEKQAIDGASFSGTLSLSLPVGAYVVWLDAAASTSSNGGRFGYADPHTYTDSSFALANPGFSIDTDGVGNQVGAFSRTPGPGTFASLGGVLLIVGAIRRRRRRV